MTRGRKLTETFDGWTVVITTKDGHRFIALTRIGFDEVGGRCFFRRRAEALAWRNDLAQHGGVKGGKVVRARVTLETTS